MSDALKMAVRAGLVAIIIAAIILFLTSFAFLPTLDFSLFYQALGLAYGVLDHWIPWFSTIWLISISMFGVVILSKITIPLSLTVTRIIAWINQG